MKLAWIIEIRMIKVRIAEDALYMHSSNQLELSRALDPSTDSAPLNELTELRNSMSWPYIFYDPGRLY